MKVLSLYRDQLEQVLTGQLTAHLRRHGGDVHLGLILLHSTPGPKKAICGAVLLDRVERTGGRWWSIWHFSRPLRFVRPVPCSVSNQWLWDLPEEYEEAVLEQLEAAFAEDTERRRRREARRRRRQMQQQQPA